MVQRRYQPILVFLNKPTCMIKRLILLLLCLMPLVRAGAQYYETGQDPASLRWHQIQTPHFRVIYPDNFTVEAQKYARLLEESYRKLSVLYPNGKTRIPVIIHNYSMRSNGYVTWAPRRMELFPRPGQDNLPMDPAKSLVVHETTHVLQFASLNKKGLGKAVWYLLGEQSIGLSALEIPPWAFEGDAVYAETVTGLSGRGRSNAFTQSARALTARPDGIYGYDKMIDGSYKDFTPDHYVFGYLMMNHLRSQDEEAWTNAISKVSSGYPFNPINNSLKKETGLTKKKLYDSTFYYLAEMWNDSAMLTLTEYPALNIKKKRDYTSHYLPHRIDDSKIVSLKTSLTHPSRFVITDISGGTEHGLTTTGYIYPYIFSYSDSFLVWSELHSDPRWENREYSVIKKMSIAGGPIIQLTFRTRYDAPDLSPDGRTIVAVSTTPELHYSLVFIDAFNGETLMDVAIPGNIIVQRPAWSSDGRAVTVVTLSEEGEGIRTYYPTGKKWIVNMPETVTDIIQAEIVNDTLYYLAQGDGSDNVYRVSNDTNVSRVTASRYGISGFSISGNEILFSEYSTGGFNIASADRIASAGPVTGSMKNIIPVVAPLPSLAGDEPLPETISYEAKPYSKAGHLLNFHSWFPFYTDIDELRSDPTAIRPGVTLLSQNHLSTLISTIGYEYSDGSHYLHSGIKWKGWYPVIEADLTYGGKQIVTKDSSTTQDPADISGDMILNTSVYDQLWFARGKFRQLFMPALYMNYRNRYTYLTEENEYDKGIVLLTGRLYLSNTFRTAYRDINPRWGQVIDLRITAAPWDNDLYGSRRYAKGILFFPGFFTNHSFVLSTGYENQQPVREMLYRNNVAYPRGYGDNLISEKLFSFSADYTMPLFYPDLAAGSLLYLKRIRGSLFFDGSTGWGTYDYEAKTFTKGSTDFGSFGAELLADFYLLRLPFELSAGASGGYIPAEKRPFIRAVFSANIYGTVLGRKR
jgi:hypothetical protein